MWSVFHSCIIRIKPGTLSVKKHCKHYLNKDMMLWISRYVHVYVCIQAGELDVLTAVLKWGEQQLVRRIEERGETRDISVCHVYKLSTCGNVLTKLCSVM